MICLLLSAQLRGVSPVLLSKIWRVESYYGHGALISRTNDYGPLQINDIAIEHYKLNKSKLSNLCYSFQSSAKILQDLKARFPKSYACRYNIGTATIDSRRQELCNIYLNKLGGNMVINMKEWKKAKEVENFAKAKLQNKLKEALAATKNLTNPKLALAVSEALLILKESEK